MPDLTLESSNQNSLNDPLNDLLVEGINNNVHNNKESEKINLSNKHRAIFTRGHRDKCPRPPCTSPSPLKN